MSTVKTDHLQALGKTTEYVYTPQPSLLERFENPLKKLTAALLTGNADVGALNAVNIVAPEFTSLCPLTGQPDFATIVIDYAPDDWCVESKALKLYLGSYRMAGDFHESCVGRIATDLWTLLDPLWLRVRGEFTPRGGIPFWPVSIIVNENKVQGAISLRRELYLETLRRR